MRRISLILCIFAFVVLFLVIKREWFPFAGEVTQKNEITSKAQQNHEDINPFKLLEPSRFNELERAINNGLDVGNRFEALMRSTILRKNYRAADLILKAQHNIDGSASSALITAIDIYEEDPSLSLRFISLLLSNGANINYVKRLPNNADLYWPTVAIAVVCKQDETHQVNQEHVDIIFNYFLPHALKPREQDVQDAIKLFSYPELVGFEKKCSKKYLSLITE